MADGISLADASQHLSDAQDALTKARKSVQYGIGDRQLTRARVTELSAEVQYWSRMVRELTDKAAGVTNPGFMTPKWN